MTIRLLICDDQMLVRDGLAMLFRLERDIEVVGLACDGVEALELTMQTAPDLVLMDLKMPRMNGVEATRRIRAAVPTTRVLVLTTYDDDSWVFEAIRCGAAGYILKDTPRDDLLKAVRGTVEGRSYIDPAVAGKLLGQVSGSVQQQPAAQIISKLTEREVAVLRQLVQGLNNAAIARQMQLSEGTVRNHVSAILSKLEVADRTQAVLLAVRHGLGE